MRCQGFKKLYFAIGGSGWNSCCPIAVGVKKISILGCSMNKICAGALQWKQAKQS